MSNRERWIVYPLIFMALGVSLHDRFFQHIQTKTVTSRDIAARTLHSEAILSKQLNAAVGQFDTLTCRQLIVLGGTDGKTGVVTMSENDKHGGIVQVLDAQGKRRVALASITSEDDKKHDGVVQVLDSQGKSCVVLTSSQGGGIVQTAAANGKLLVLLEHDPLGGGRIAVFDNENRLFFVRPTIGPILNLTVPDAPPVTEEAPPNAPPQEQQPSPPTEEPPREDAPDEPGA